MLLTGLGRILGHLSAKTILRWVLPRNQAGLICASRSLLGVGGRMVRVALPGTKESSKTNPAE